MPNRLLTTLIVTPGLQEQRGLRGPKVMKPDSLQSRFAHEPFECVGEELGVDGEPSSCRKT